MNNNQNIPMQFNDKAYCLMHLEPLLLELDKFPKFIKGHIAESQVKHCIDKVKANRTYEARMSLYQVQNRLAYFASDASEMKGNIGYMRSLLRCFYLMSEAGRPLGHTLAAKTAMPFRVDQVGGAV